MVKRQGLVLEVHDKWAIILNKKGQYKKVKIDRPVQVGELWSESSAQVWKLATAAVIILALLAACADFFSVVAYAQVSSGVKIGVNRWDRVVTAEASDAQTAEYLKKVHLTGRKVDEAVEQVVNDTIVPGDTPVLTVTTTKKDENNRRRLVQKLNKKVQPVVDRKVDQVKGSNDKSEGNSNLAPDQNGGAEHSSKKTIKGNSKVNVIDTTGQLNLPSDSQNKGKVYHLPEVSPLLSEPEMHTKVIKANKNGDFLPGGQKGQDSLPAAVNKANNNKVEDRQKLPSEQSEKVKTAPKYTNKHITGSGQSDQGTNKKSD